MVGKPKVQDNSLAVYTTTAGKRRGVRDSMQTGILCNNYFGRTWLLSYTTPHSMTLLTELVWHFRVYQLWELMSLARANSYLNRTLAENSREVWEV